jgi:tetratricopeptide (TPR) repeat protein
VAGAQKNAGDLASARATYETALRLAEEIATRPDATIYERSNVASAHQSLGDILGNPEQLNLGDRERVLAHYRKAQRIAEELAAADPKDIRARSDLSDLYRSFGAVLLDGDPAEAFPYYSKALAISEELSAADPANLAGKRHLALDLLGTGGALRGLERKDEAAQHARRGLALMQSVIAAAPGEIGWMVDLCRGYAVLGRILLARGDETGAVENYEASLVTAEKLLQRNPAALNFQRARADALASLARCYLSLRARPDRKAIARTRLEESLTVWRDWNIRGVATPYAARRFDETLSVIKSLR